MNQITRRGFLKPAAAFPAVWAGGRRSPRPNILFAPADDWSWPHASIAGDSIVKTTVFDRVARAGVMFVNAHVCAPQCSPSRAAMLTGQHPWRLEQAGVQAGAIAPKFPVYPDLLETAGYHVGFTRKGWGPGNETAAGRTRNPAGPKFNDFQSFMRERPQGKPFCFWFGSTDPHRPYVWDSGVSGGMRIEDVNVPPYLPDCETIRKDICDYYGKLQRYDRETGELFDLLEKSGELENTMVVMSADNGWPFPRSKATLYGSGTHVPLAISWPARFKPGRVVRDFVTLADLAPTFLEAAGVAPPPIMSARSLMSVLTSGKSGQVDPKRDHLLTGFEHHMANRGGVRRKGYPARALVTREFHYIRNFQPDRWPAGDPNGVEKPGANPFKYEQLVAWTFNTAFADIDPGPTKAWMILHRGEPGVRPLYDLAVARRAERELYDLRRDPYQMRNVAADAQCADVIKRLDRQLMEELNATGDPRAEGRGEVFESYR